MVSKKRDLRRFYWTNRTNFTLVVREFSTSFNRSRSVRSLSFKEAIFTKRAPANSPPTFSSFKVSPPDRGSFPLDHDGECKSKMLVYMSCLQKNANNSAQCRPESKEYLECRMSRGLMEREEWKNLGMANIQTEGSPSCATCSANNTTPSRTAS